MKNLRFPWQRRNPAAFTLIELLVVIAVIGILAALIFPITAALDKQKKIKVAQTELGQIQTAIEGYKEKLGFYPPDNPNNVVSNQLYFELLGTTNNGAGLPGGPTLFVTMDGSGQLSDTDANAYFSAKGIANSSAQTRTTDEGTAAKSFLSNLRPNQIGSLDGGGKIKILVCAVEWPADKIPAPTLNPKFNPWRYTSSHPTNNAGSYDLWVDLVIKGKTNRVSNWSRQPTIL
jgi:prepilin-type N-terminal cleavage/methylation domain-containing protein